MNVSEPIEAFSVRKYGNLSCKISNRKGLSTDIGGLSAWTFDRKQIMQNLNSALKVLNALCNELLVGRFIASRGLSLALLI